MSWGGHDWSGANAEITRLRAQVRDLQKIIQTERFEHARKLEEEKATLHLATNAAELRLRALKQLLSAETLPDGWVQDLTEYVDCALGLLPPLAAPHIQHGPVMHTVVFQHRLSDDEEYGYDAG